MYYLDSASMDPAWNLALEQFVFDQLGPREDCFMLWQNDRTIVVGKYQNVLEEINSTYVTNAEAGHGLLRVGGAIVPFANEFPRTGALYQLWNTTPTDK